MNNFWYSAILGGGAEASTAFAGSRAVIGKREVQYDTIRKTTKC